MPLAYLGPAFLIWTLFVGGLSSALVHVDNAAMAESPSIVITIPASDSTNNETVDVATLAAKSETLTRTIATSHIAAKFASALTDATSSQDVLSTTASSSQETTGQEDSENIVVDSFLALIGKKADYSLKVDVVGNGHVIYSSGSICGGVCSVAYKADSSATLVAAPGPDSVFTGWKGACEGTDSCVIKMVLNKSVTATFTEVPVEEQKNTLPKQPVVTEAEVAKHAVTSDCWIIVSQKVYSVTNYLAMHPGGKSVIVKVCGKDATAVFTDRGGTGSHSRSAWSLLGTFLVGVLPSFDQSKVSNVKEYTPEDIAKHATPSDCWISILDSVYSVSSYIALHPGGRLNIERVCGQDATEIFNNRDQTGSHSSYAWSLLNAYLVGALTTTAPASLPVTTATTTKTTTTPTSNTSSSEFTLSQIAAHSTKTDCWIIVSNTIYSVGSYIAMHPGGTTAITNLCGKDATSGFTNRGGTGAHSGSAWTMLGGYIVGTVAGTNPAPVQIPTTPVVTPAPPTPPANVSSVTYSLAQVATHAVPSDCWIIVSNKIYAVSSYTSMHPGGMSIINGLCGKDATADFTSRAGTGSHSSYAWGLLGGYLIGSVGAASTVTPPAPAPAPVVPPVTTPPPAPTATFTHAQVATHATQADCWIVVSNNIYSIGSYMAMHPGGTAVITPSCGKEATTAFTTKNKGSIHSSYAWGLLGAYIVGSVTGTTPAPVPAPNPVPAPAPTGGPYTAAQIGTHSTPSDCWIVVGTNVYSVGSYVAMHPGGISSITNLCGKDATTAFATKNGIGAHSAGAQSMLGSYLVGALSGPPPSSTPAPAPAASSYTSAQVAAHSSMSDCWIVIGTNVYSVSAYLAMHPGGGYAISKYCGKNASTAFGNKGGIGKSHSSSANTMLGGFLVGTLSGVAPASSPVMAAPATVYNTTDVAAHASASDCWIIVNTSVYSVAPYISLHPGGRTKISNLCGKNATSGFNGEHGGSTKVKNMLGGFVIGNYSATAVTAPTAVNGTCGTSNNTTVSSAPTSGLCTTGTATSVSGTGPYTWSCTGSNGGTTASCSATHSATAPAPTAVNGVCGSSNNTTVSSAPTTGLCTAGTATSVSGTGPYTWSCGGQNGGTTASCSATKTATTVAQTYTVTVNSSRTLSSSGMTLNAGDKVVFSYTSGSGEAKITISPSTVSSASFTLDKEKKTRTVTINASGSYTFKTN